MEIFSPYEVEIKTGWSVEEMMQKLQSKATITGNHFRIDTEPYSVLPLSYVKGEVRTKGDYTVVSFSTHASVVLLLFFTVVMGFLGSATIYYIVIAIKDGAGYDEVKGILLMALVAFVLMQLSFKTSADKQEHGMRQLMRE
ncbi:MAG: hypothetical protein HOP30_15375 [Cyclobacteriaceae bacterium]|nr:hypothetical protein [Cyclobacteriaceae bacterium]